ncbi:divergent protein kinase domain 2A [Diachasma alloeum]|uniref:divergent protein kinase domain 2A n=1 Tax=Diachasma alloeum TaxID=454923 RepID=UPI0007383D74|nr:divergent protein kinase domain 2A [Diachasma alloeum]
MCFQKISKFRRKIVSLLFLSIITINYLKNLLCPAVSSLAEFEKCPACYGSSACPQVLNENIKIKPFDFRTTMSHILPSKNVFFGESNGKKIVVKKLAQYEELEAFDQMICKEGLDCCAARNYNNEHAHSIDYFSRILNDVSSDFISDDRSGLIICPNPTSTIFFDKLRGSRYLNDSNLWTLVRINPEPIILEILRAEEGWPVPRYYGACGRIVIEEYVGLPLPAYYHAPWLLRAKIAAGLLRAAQMLTFHDPEFSFYLTDMSPDNIAINDEYKPIFVDLEHIIVVQKNSFSNDKIHDFRELHETEETFACKNCFAFSPLDICSHRLSDHNYYAVCKHILSPESSTATISGGFLHDVPKDISSRYPDLKIMLAECSVPSARQTRIETAAKLIELFEKMS